MNVDKLSDKSKNTYNRLKIKDESNHERMPSLQSIYNLLHECGIDCRIDSSTNIVEYRSKGRRYVNSRHNGKEGKRLEITDSALLDKTGIMYLEMDTSDSYYSCNSWAYAAKLLQIINEK